MELCGTSCNASHAVWILETGGGVHSSPTVGSDGMVFVGSYDTKLYAVDPGALLSCGTSCGLGDSEWTYATGSSVRSSPAIDAAGVVYIGSEDHNLHAVFPPRLLAAGCGQSCDATHASPRRK